MKRPLVLILLSALLLGSCLKAQLIPFAEEKTKEDVLGTSTMQFERVGNTLAYGTAEVSVREGGVEFSLRVSAIQEDGRSEYVAALIAESAQGVVEEITLGKLKSKGSEAHFLKQVLPLDLKALQSQKLTLQVKLIQKQRTHVVEQIILIADVPFPRL